MYVLKKWRNTNMGIELRTAFYTLAKKNVTQRFRKQENCGAKQGCE